MESTASSSKYQEIIHLRNTVDKADREFGQDLWLIAERIVLNRITKATDSRLEIDSILRETKQIRSESQESLARGNGDELEANQEGHTFDNSPLSSGFSQVVDLLESLDSGQLYRLIAWLRNEI